MVNKKLKDCYDLGYRGVAICLLHSYAFYEHEERVAGIAQRIGFTNIVASHETVPVIKAYPRASTTCVETYLNPTMQGYFKKFIDGLQPWN